jgi:SAM-dependent methyltransferase
MVVEEGLARFASGFDVAGAALFFLEPGGQPEYLILGGRPERWDGVDSLAWAIMMAWDLGGNWNTELLRLRLSLQMPVEPASFTVVMSQEAFAHVPDKPRLIMQCAQALQPGGGHAGDLHLHVGPR